MRWQASAGGKDGASILGGDYLPEEAARRRCVVVLCVMLLVLLVLLLGIAAAAGIAYFEVRAQAQAQAQIQSSAEHPAMWWSRGYNTAVNLMNDDAIAKF